MNDRDDPRFERLVRGSNRTMFVGTHRTWLATSLEALTKAWAASSPPPSQPTFVIDDLLALDEQSTTAVDTLLQSIALLVSPPMLLMQLYVLRRGGIVSFSTTWRARGSLTLRFVVADVDGVERTFESIDANDMQVLKQLQVWPDRDMDDDGWVADVAIVAGFKAVELGLPGLSDQQTDDGRDEPQSLPVRRR